MARSLPPLNALRAFEAAARHLSFTKAADELSVTQAAVSHQVKALETHLGIRLFRRLNRALLLTEEGQAYLPAIRQAFDGIAESTARLRSRDASGALTVSVLASFAAKWLVPRLAQFRERRPDIDVRITTSDDLVDFLRDDVDVAIRYGPGRYPGLRVDRFMSDAILPVCSPGFLRGKSPLREPDDIHGHTLLYDDMPTGWSDWLRAAGARRIDPADGPFFNQSDLLLQAALAGQGIALGRTSLIIDDLASGRLVAPLSMALPVADSYYVVCLSEMADRPKIRAFREWLVAEARLSDLRADTGTSDVEEATE